jgi:hypothetical protein
MIHGRNHSEILLFRNEVFSSDQLCENGVNVQRFGDSLCLHHQGLMERETVSVAFYINSILTRLIFREDTLHSVAVKYSKFP